MQTFTYSINTVTERGGSRLGPRSNANATNGPESSTAQAAAASSIGSPGQGSIEIPKSPKQITDTLEVAGAEDVDYDMSYQDSLGGDNSMSVGNSMAVGNSVAVGDSMAVGNSMAVGDSMAVGNSMSVGNSMGVSDSMAVGNSMGTATNVVVSGPTASNVIQSGSTAPHSSQKSLPAVNRVKSTEMPVRQGRGQSGAEGVMMRSDHGWRFRQSMTFT